MSYGYLDLAVTPAVKAAQAHNGSRGHWESLAADRSSDRFTEAEAAFIQSRDSFYIATVSETGWPYMQHRGGPVGFLKVLDDRTLGFADYRGNRQYLSVGNLSANSRASLFLMDYARRARLKIFAELEVKDIADDPDLAARLASPGYRAKAERSVLVHLKAFDWNCPQHITPRFTEAEIAQAVAPLRAHLQQLEADNASLRATLAELETK
ncbi:pyridoxamine 5'-phosphate oxidase family protein [Rhodopseudomonas sp. B29]|uniref:pyridoxamine 5'-phosphate oxidase family protein n=1 Tax=Rhodopseudomonas sp. B29 TaxID=95607 RepID=UPI0003456080|nr:pyridoxamine 5'-phosphate oxidase family protein [Rhodopseudomonas sp. B29]